MTRAWPMIAALAILMVAGCGGGGDGPQPPGPPTITGASVTPTDLRFTGGAVQISATVNAPAGVAGVRATVGVTEVPLALVGAQYEGLFTAPPNAGSSAAGYTVTVTATDTQGRTSAAFAAGSFSVQAAERPPGTPSGW